ncbi:hypothetical protein MMC26_000719 [Xylographa opegraphella]|nr:hypothetical protein [Xylographa opegraphella]
MGSAPEDLSEELSLQHCRFPISSQRNIEDRTYDVVSAFPDGATLPALGKGFESSKDLVLAAWALLLRTYLRNGSVAFAVISGDQALYSDQRSANGVPLSEGTGVSVVLFQCTDECRLKDIRVAASWRSTEPTLKASNINTAQFDLILNYNATQSLIDVTIGYKWPAISKPYAHAVASTFRKIMSGLVFENECTVGQLDSVSEEDKQRMISWNPKDPYAQMSCMHHLVEATIRAIPDSEAICAWDGSLTYTQLNQFSSIAAKHLIQAGVVPGMFVPFMYEKSLWTVIATLAILKAGGAFVPLDPAHPRSRIEEILNSLQATVIVTSDMFASTLVGLVKRVVTISATTVNKLQSHKAHDFTSIDTTPHDPIFVLFTSGSTGKPKGMIHEHGAICTHAITHGEAMGYHGARVLQFAAHTFDVAIIDIFTTLIFGGVICIPSEEDRRSNIVGVINSMKADFAILTPSFAGLIEPSTVPSLRTLAIGGEALPQDHIERWATKVSLIQIYGPAEVGICLMLHMHPSQTLPETVGYTLHNSLCWLVDPDDPQRLVPIGAVGELVVAGPSLARGYLNDEAKTRSSFLEHLSWARELRLKCQRFYLTGDLLRINTSSFDGSYDFVGRKDSQIKLRGQRIEPGEIEHHVRRIPGIAKSIVIRPKQGCFAEELVAVVQMQNSESNPSRILHEPISLAPDQSLSIEDLWEHLGQSLPGYMIPTACLVIERMPFVPSLKIDRKSINEWLVNMESRPSKIAYTTMLDLKTSKLDATEVTANELSLKVAELVAFNDVVKREMLAKHDFKLQSAGIDSIQIISLSMFLQKEHGVKVPMDVLLSPQVSIRDLAHLVDHADQPWMCFNETVKVDLRQEVEHLSEGLFRDIKAQSPNTGLQKKIPIQNVFLTGASGYLGSAILQHLIERPNVHAFALVRCFTEPIGFRRIVDAAVKSGWWQDTFRTRIKVWKGDFTKSDLGLNTQQLSLLRGVGSPNSHCIHAIIHNGARVHYSSAYETLKPLNVSPTLELLRTAALSPTISAFVYVSGGQKPNHSSSGTSSPAGPRPSASDPHPADGYAFSKAVSEQLVRACVPHPAFQHTRLSTLKPGYIIGTASAGVALTRDFLWRLVAACIDIGAYNATEASHWLFVADVGRVARRAVAALWPSAGAAAPHVDRVLDGLPFARVWALLSDEFGYALEPLPYEAWMERLRARVGERREAHGLFPMLHVLERDGGQVGVEVEKWWDMEGEAEMMRVVKRNVEYLIEIGFLPRPGRGAGVGVDQ